MIRLVLRQKSFAGTLESSDVFVEVSPGGGGINIEIESVVLDQFGDELRETVEDVLRQLEITDASLSLKDRGALECTVRARVETALRRALGPDQPAQAQREEE